MALSMAFSRVDVDSLRSRDENCSLAPRASSTAGAISHVGREKLRRSPTRYTVVRTRFTGALYPTAWGWRIDHGLAGAYWSALPDCSRSWRPNTRPKPRLPCRRETT